MWINLYELGPFRTMVRVDRNSVWHTFFNVEVSHWRLTKSVSWLGLWSVWALWFTAVIMINKKSNIFKRYCHSISLSLIFEVQVTSSSYKQYSPDGPQANYFNSETVCHTEFLRVRSDDKGTSFEWEEKNVDELKIKVRIW